jgi:hypothetical protein
MMHRYRSEGRGRCRNAESMKTRGKEERRLQGMLGKHY